jgi:hypothetical protein
MMVAAIIYIAFAVENPKAFVAMKKQAQAQAS